MLPFENDTRRIERRIAARSLRAGRRRNALAGLVIFGAAFLLSFTVLLAVNAMLDLNIKEGTGESGETAVVLLAIALVILLTAGLAIRNIMYLSVLARTRDFAQLRTIGASKKQVYRIVSYERKRMARPYSVAGLVAGVVVNAALPLTFNVWVSVLCVLVCGVFIWFVVYAAFRAPAKRAASASPMAVLQEGRVVRAPRHQGSMSPRRIGGRYLSEDRRKTALTLASLIFSGLLLFVVFTVLSAINIEQLARQPYYEDSSLYIKINSTADEESTYRIMRTAPFSTALHEELMAIPSVEHIVPLAMLDVALPDVGFEGAIQSVMPHTMTPHLVEGVLAGKATEEGVLPVTINRASPYYQETGLDLSVGDQITATVDTGDEEKAVRFEVSGILENKDDGVVFYTDTENLQALATMDCTLAWYIVTTPERAEGVTQAVQQLVTGDEQSHMSADERVYVANLADDIAFYKDYFANARLAIGVLTLLVASFALLNLLNTCITNSVVREGDYALLEAIGMSRRQLLQAQRAENAVYFLGSFLGSAVLGSLFGWWICDWLASYPGLGYIEYHFPFAFLVCYAAFVAAVYGVVRSYQRWRLDRSSVVSRLRTSL